MVDKRAALYINIGRTYAQSSLGDYKIERELNIAFVLIMAYYFVLFSLSVTARVFLNLFLQGSISVVYRHGMLMFVCKQKKYS